jgi:hypothetical protein
MTTLLKNWHFMRLLRAGIALWAFAEVWRTGDLPMLFLGSIFALQAIFDIGCCGASGCALPEPGSKSPKPD